MHATSATSAPAPLLLVEDDAELRDGLCEVLQLEGYRVEEAEDGAQALARLAQTERVPPAALVLDMMMPGVSGWEVLEAMRERGGAIATLPVIVITAAGHLALDTAPPVQRVLHKPFPIPELLHALRACGVVRSQH